MRAIQCSLLLGLFAGVVGCTGPMGTTDSETDTPTTTDDTGTEPTRSTADTGDPTTFVGSLGVQCTMDPALGGDVETIRVSDKGVVWLSVFGDLFRYERTDGGKGCALTGSLVWSADDLQDVTDFDLDAAGRAYLLVFFSDIVRMSAEGTEELRCKNAPSGHGITVSDAGDRVWTVPIGSDVLQWADVGEADCVYEKTGVKMPDSISTHPVYVDGNLAIDYHDPGNELPPAGLFDPTDGSQILSIGTGTVSDETLVGLSDLAPAAEGYWAVGTFGDLWRIDAKGIVLAHHEGPDILPNPKSLSILPISSVAYTSTGDSYLAAGFIDFDGVWAIEL